MIVQVKHTSQNEYLLPNINLKETLVSIANKCSWMPDSLSEGMLEFFKQFDMYYSAGESHSDAMYEVNICGTYCKVKDLKNKEVYYVTPPVNAGNCVDKFCAYKLKSNLATLDYLFTNIDKRWLNRKDECEYHNSTTFEHDFADMTKMKEVAQRIIYNINKFQEQLTIDDYTA